jgi:23S rRNA (guanine2445-N2)-methyltransferase / 23S rRNA (guanine2069-N7)-methyltransferase
MDTTFDVERDHVQLLSSLKELLRPGGSIIFSNNRKNFRFDYDKIGELGFTVRDLSAETLSKDYVKAKALHNCWLLTL